VRLVNTTASLNQFGPDDSDVRDEVKQGLYGAVAWVAVGTTLRVAVSNWTVVDAVARSLVGAVAFGAVYGYVTYRRGD